MSHCLADITTNNPNVWYELGYAFAAARSVIMLCSSERNEGKFPFDIQHRTIITYDTESSSDFAKLRDKITERANALLAKGAALRQLAESDQIATTDGLSQTELMVLAILAGDTAIPDSATSLYSLKDDAERSGLTKVGFGLAFRRLLRKGLIENIEIENDFNEPYEGVLLTDPDWGWIEENESLFVTKKSDEVQEKFDSDIPF